MKNGKGEVYKNDLTIRKYWDKSPRMTVREGLSGIFLIGACGGVVAAINHAYTKSIVEGSFDTAILIFAGALVSGVWGYLLSPQYSDPPSLEDHLIDQDDRKLRI